MRGSKPRRPKTQHTGEIITNSPPDWLNKYAAEIWRITIDQIGEAGGSIPMKFCETFTGYCLSAAAARESDEILTRDGLTVCDGRAGTRRHPLVSVRSQALLQLRSYAESLGLTPASSGRLPPPPLKPESNPFEDL